MSNLYSSILSITFIIIKTTAIFVGGEDYCEGFDGYEAVCYEPDWSGSNTCMVQVKTSGTCSTYCENQGSTCVRAQDNTSGCYRDEDHNEGCDETWNDQICACEMLG